MPNNELRYPLLDRLYQRYLNDERSATFIQDVTSQYTVGTLQRLAVGGNRITRRAAVLALGFVGDYACNDLFGSALRDTDRAVRLLADHGIRQIWFRVNDHAIRATLAHLVRLNNHRRFDDTIELASDVLRDEPNVAELWNQRAIAFYAQELYSDAAFDCQNAFELNPYHFPAMMGMAHCYMQLDDVFIALESFRKALDINPDLEGVRAHVQHLQRILDGK